jgi:hypothetical protein
MPRRQNLLQIITKLLMLTALTAGDDAVGGAVSGASAGLLSAM